jgi:hypothetical protein
VTSYEFADLREECERLQRENDVLHREHEALMRRPAIDRLPHFRRLDAHCVDLRAFREKLARSR